MQCTLTICCHSIRFVICIFVDDENFQLSYDVLCYVAQVSGTRVRRVRGHEYPIRLEALPKFAGNVGLGAAIIYIYFFKIY